jgi:transposase
MSLSRRRFTKEFKQAAVRRLEMGASLAEVARACEVNANVLHRWRREFRDGVDRAFPGLGNARPKKAGWPSWSARSVSRRWRSIF